MSEFFYHIIIYLCINFIYVIHKFPWTCWSQLKFMQTYDLPRSKMQTNLKNAIISYFLIKQNFSQS